MTASHDENKDTPLRGDSLDRQGIDKNTAFQLGQLVSCMTSLNEGQREIKTSLQLIHQRINLVEERQQRDDREVRSMIADLVTCAAMNKMKLAGFVFGATLLASGLVAILVKFFSEVVTYAAK